MIKVTGLITSSLLTFSAAYAETVSLQSVDERLLVNGEILGTDGVVATLKSDRGIINVSTAAMNCVAGDCDVGIRWANTVSELSVSVSGERQQAVVEMLAQAMAEDDAYVVSTKPTEKEHLVTRASGYTSGQAVYIRLLEDDMSAQTYLDMAPPAGVSAQPDLVQPPSAQLIGMDALSVIAHPLVDVDGLSLEDLARIYAGEISNWSALGGPDQDIVLLRREPDSPELTSFEATVMQPYEKAVSPQALAVPSDLKLAEYVAQFPGSIAVVSTQVETAANSLPLMSSCGAYHEATPFAVASGSYPLLRPLYAIHQADPDAATTAFFDKAVTDVMPSYAARLGFTFGDVMEQSPSEKDVHLTALLAEDMPDGDKGPARALVDLMFASSRLSTTFIAGDLTAEQVAWNRAQMLRLEKVLKSDGFSDREAVFAGFSGADGSLAESRLAAAQIMDDFRAFSMSRGSVDGRLFQLSSVGFGAVAGSECAARGTQKRVEVWLRDMPISG